jgi:hypothetical protein
MLKPDDDKTRTHVTLTNGTMVGPLSLKAQ